MTIKLKSVVFWPSFIILVIATVLSLVNLETFSSTISKVTVWSMGFFGAGYEVLTVIMFFGCIAVVVMPFGRVKIGGSNAKPLLKPFSWFAVSLAVTVATALLFWAALEPVYHVTQPPASLGIEPNSPAAAIFALSTVYMHWSFLPYAIYGIPIVMFAFAYYNMKKPFAVSSMLAPIFGNRTEGIIGDIVDSAIVLSLVLGVANSLGVGTLLISGGLNYIWGVPSNMFVWLIVMSAIVVAFVISAITGLSNGVKKLAEINLWVFFFFIAWVILFGSTLFNINLGIESFAHMLDNFFSKSLFTGVVAEDQWPIWWTIWYFAAWMAWAPISAVFLGRVSYGYSVRAVVTVNVFFASLFNVIWFTFFSGTAIHMQIFQKAGLGDILANKGAEMVNYAFFSHLPLGALISAIFVATAYLTYVAGADAMCATLAGLSTFGISPDSPEPPAILKIIWGAILGTVAWITMSFAGLDGLKALSNLGGIPTLILLAFVTYALMKVAWNPYKYDTFKEDYDEFGQPKRLKITELSKNSDEQKKLPLIRN
ncbi:BCCT family transporter [Sporomusa termitida]|uniref:Glycine betaine transporter BetL n=1 Tax=Sporomusa termitida TaxID=2377 RepID=A0A517DYX1_9FIRM|nr:BCCT family transporter [Sporomusa termitida]QDR82543.1 Glycine betaine transporter BetL [Sporomusa termitida]